MGPRILFIDDANGEMGCDVANLPASFEAENVPGALQGLAALELGGPYAVVATGLRLADLDGVEFLKRASALCPDTIRIVLTSSADQGLARAAVNEGQVFRFLTRPCSREDFAQALVEGVRQHELVRTERDLLEETLGGTIKVLMEMLSTADPVTFGVAALASSLAEEVGRRLGLEATWSLRIATMLAPIGLMTLPPAVLRRYRDGESLTEQERQIFDHLPEIGERLLLPIPRLEQVASIIRHQGQDCSGQDAGIPLEARILKAVTDFTALRCRALTATRALELMVGEPGRYDPEVIQALRDMHRDDTQGGTAQAEVREVWIGDLRVGQVLASAMATMEGAVVLPKGTPLSYCHLEKAQNHARLFGLREPIKVFEIQ